MRDIPAAADIHCPAEKIFDLITDFRGQHRWLTTSSSYHGTTEVAQNPAVLGTTYREPGPFGVRNGLVTEYERPTKITFHQPMTMKWHSGIVDVTMRYTLAPNGQTTHVERHVTLGIPGQLKPLRPLIERAFRIESSRTLVALKAYADELE
ncbi:MAG: SRPBCC family protein [Streptosporangiaceae bacterium]